ncbi:MAG: indoleamine 2,3-dioxygenase [Candidatus Thiodiazotropha sp. (ex Monitilora ramsayi)]|nr:indoleamine 2,3-dioxygenase [Candidatus Thiodiazotropha sp. (ex Monitilora ramsayi)]
MIGQLFSNTAIFQRGFLPERDPVTHFPKDTEWCVLDEIGNELPRRLEETDFRTKARDYEIPACPKDWSVIESVADDPIPYMHLYYVRMGFLASGYINQIKQERATLLPSNIAVPLCEICRQLQRPPILSYDGYALFNWYRIDPNGPVTLGNLDTFQNFVRLYDEHWFILVHVEIEALASHIIKEIIQLPEWLKRESRHDIDQSLNRIADTIQHQVQILKRIPEKMDPALYYKTFRLYIRLFENVHYEGVKMETVDFRGETGAQSSIMPMLVALMKIPHEESLLTRHLKDMWQYMPRKHVIFLNWVESLPDFRSLASPEAFNRVLEAIAVFRKVHFGWAEEYINKRTDDPRGTGGTPYMQWLQQLINETLAYRK